VQRHGAAYTRDAYCCSTHAPFWIITMTAARCRGRVIVRTHVEDACAPAVFFTPSSALRSATLNSLVPGWAVFSATGMAACSSTPVSQACAPKRRNAAFCREPSRTRRYRPVRLLDWMVVRQLGRNEAPAQPATACLRSPCRRRAGSHCSRHRASGRSCRCSRAPSASSAATRPAYRSRRSGWHRVSRPRAEDLPGDGRIGPVVALTADDLDSRVSAILLNSFHQPSP